MVKVQATAKFIRELPVPKVQIGYCDAQRLLSACTPFAYTCGVYGWNFDAYDLGGLIVTTGYRNMIGPDVSDIASRFEKEAETVCFEYPASIRRESLAHLVDRFRAEVLASIA